MTAGNVFKVELHIDNDEIKKVMLWSELEFACLQVLDNLQIWHKGSDTYEIPSEAIVRLANAVNAWREAGSISVGTTDKMGEESGG